MTTADEDKQTCPKCGKRATRQMGSGSGIIFKGPGFYATDNRTMADARPNKKRTTRRTKKHG